jgi:hypothetical protein
LWKSKARVKATAQVTSKMKQLIHQGVLIPKRYEPKGFHVRIDGQQVALTPLQEEMAVAWVKKLGTDYVKDPVFIKNFFQDFSKEMGMSDRLLSLEQVDFSEIIAFVEKEKQIKANMSKEEKKKHGSRTQSTYEKQTKKNTATQQSTESEPKLATTQLSRRLFLWDAASIRCEENGNPTLAKATLS